MNKSDIKNAGLKITLPRVKILTKLESSDKRHWSAEELYQELISDGEIISLATVYRVLTQFEHANIVLRHHFDNDSTQSVFELNNTEHHDHMVSIKTGKVVEFYDEDIEKRQKLVAKKYKFKIQDHSLVLYGEFEDE
ncbi:MAG: ferric iron uptake transcriptional regulator [Gammaproteobacteria bacterium]|mgnify:FL=1|jgi:Fur family ferric uptake transcriptional regulator|nr:ferric iron uptake transcriptional regulator [Gammaproteobacteria bacterium]|tara:strand:- start:962 stop:1372 length:411 start_codon:yes stop_codon:yes gene_type:complete